MSVILCDKCGDGVYLTTEIVSLPFVCEACELSAAIRESAKPPKPNKRGKFSNGVLTNSVPFTAMGKQTGYRKVSAGATKLSFWGRPDPAGELEPQCETATVDATTELIEDLTRQLAAEKSLASVLLKSAEVLANDNVEYKNLMVEARGDAALLFADLQAEKASATRAQADIARLEQELVTAELKFQKETERTFYYIQRISGERNVLRKQVADHQQVIRDLNDDLIGSRNERSYLRTSKQLYRDLAIERLDHPFQTLWVWFKRLF